MNPISIILLVCAIVNASLLVFVFQRRHSQADHFAFAALVLSITAWNLTNFLVAAVGDLAILTTVGRCAFATGAVIGTCFLVFTWHFPEQHHPRPSQVTQIAVIFVAGVVVGLTCTNLIQLSVEWTPTGKQPVFGRLYLVYVLYMLLTYVWGTANLVYSRWRTPSGRERMQLNYALTGFILGFLIVYVGQFILPFLGVSSDYYLLLGGVSSLVWIGTTSYALFRHRLMDIGIALRNGVIHGSLAALLAGVIVVPFVLHRYAFAEAPPATEFLIVAIAAVCLTLLLPRVQRALTRFVDHRLFGGRYDHETALVKFGDHFQRAYGRGNIARVAASEFTVIMQTEEVAVYLPDNDGAYVLSASRSGEDFRRPEHLCTGHPLLREVVGNGRRLIREDLAWGLNPTPGSPAIIEMLAAQRAEVVMPLACQDHNLGILFLGEKRNDNLYTTDDLQLLGALASQVGIALDNTRLYEQVLESEKQYKTVLKHIQRGVLSTDTRLCIRTLNTTGAQILGKSQEDAIGRDAADLAPEFVDVLRRTLESGRNQPLAEATISLAHRGFPCEFETSIMVDARNHVTGVLLVFQDCTKRRQLEADVRRMDRLASVGTLAAGIAHEIKNPLVSIQTFAQLLPERFDEQVFREDFGNVVLQEIRRINRLVQSLLDFARPPAPQIGPVDVHGLIGRAATLLQTELKKKRIDLICQFAEDVPVIIADSEQLYQVFFNLIQNAIQAIDRDERKIIVSTQKTSLAARQHTKEAVLLRIQDTGRGIDEDSLQSIFDPFFSTKADGSGLGLAICHRILKEHGVQIDVQSTVGRGTVFTLSLPVDNRGGSAQDSDVTGSASC